MEAAIRTVLRFAAGHGVRCSDPAVLKDGSNLLLHLRPAPVVARIAATTALVRQNVRPWFAREVALAGYLAGRGCPVVPPSAELPPGPHEVDGVVFGFWTHVAHTDAVPAPGEFAQAMAQLHLALRDYPGELAACGPLVDLSLGVDLVGGRHAGLMRAERDRLAAELDRLDPPRQALHGDAHPGNTLRTARGLVWNDFEDTWCGPVEWDLAVLAGTSRLDGAAALAAYPLPVNPEAVAVCKRLRTLQGLVWVLASAQRAPERAAEADSVLARWLADVVRHKV
ncbi:phosphotransferase [Kutzneria albida]|uniref:Aminoglycoside phosphotransferase domain-containing protein n=1 Tax=Kutzneria albida DSM 43870 TaxID=1449976 RepID=W5W187_9PSEU|nr:phosphotransferase [Kutzneria albida]AHH94602.1 hypothetical protein KALB_1229 [Kutzneria albida DSM 43870]